MDMPRSLGFFFGDDMDKRRNIVIVDDEEMVLVSINSFLTLETNYKVTTFSHPKDALEFIKKTRSIS